MPTAPTPGAAADLIGQFLRSLEVRGMSPATRRSYASDLSQFDEWSQECGQALAGLDRSAVRAFAAALGRRGYAPATLARKLSTMRSFCRFLTERGVLAADPAQYLPGPRRRRRLPHALRPSEVDAVCDAVRGSDALALRDRLAFELLYGCGLRSQELVDLGCDDVHAQRGELLVRGKGGKMRMVPLGDEAGAALERYLASGRGARGGGGGAAGPPAPWARFCSAAADGHCTPPTCGASSPSTPALPVSRPRRTCSGTPMPRTCSSTAPTCGPSRSSSATARYRPRRFTRTSAALTSKPSISGTIRERDRSGLRRRDKRRAA
jgi:integrase